MNTGFQHRLDQAARLEKPFITAFNQHCQTHRIFKFGVESTQLADLHQYIRSSVDPTSQFIRYLPDAALVRVQDDKTDTPTLIEFKVSDSLVQHDSLFNRIQDEYKQQNPDNLPLQNKQDIFGIEQDSLNLQQRLSCIGVRVMVVAWQIQRTMDAESLRAQYGEQITICQFYTPRGKGGGSGTPIANVHFGSFIPIRQFFKEELSIPVGVMDPVVKAVKQSDADGEA